MNLYNFIYCYFYTFWEKRGNDGRVVGAAHVLFTVLMHVLLVAEIIQDITGFRLISLPAYGQYGRNRAMYMLFLIPFWMAFWIFYNRERTKRLLKKFYQEYGDELGKKNLQRILLYFILPVVLLIILALVRQNS